MTGASAICGRRNLSVEPVVVISSGQLAATNMTELAVICGDITALDIDAIVNAANSQLRGGGGVDGAIHRAAGQEQLLSWMKARYDHCPVGEAVISPGFALSARHIIHTVGPVWRGGDSREDELLARCYRSSLSLAERNGIRSIAFPAISTGAYGFPALAAARIAVGTVRRYIMEGTKLEKIVFCCLQAEIAEFHRRFLAEETPTAP